MPGAPVVSEKLVLVSAAMITVLLVAAAVTVSVQSDELASGVGDTVVPAAAGTVNTLVGWTFIATVAAFFATIWWLQGIREVGEWANPSYRHRRSSFWIPFGWVVPIVAWWFPYQVVADASRAVGSRVTTFWPWWITWLVLVPAQMFFGQRHGYEELGSSAEVSSWISGYQWGAAVAVLSFVLWWRIVRSATRAAAVAVGRA